MTGHCGTSSQAMPLPEIPSQSVAAGYDDCAAGAEQRGVIVARFLAVLELYRHSAITFEQIEPLGELTLTWSAQHWTDDSLASLGSDYDA